MRQNTITGFILLALLSLGISACGQKGPLYLPDSEQEQQR